MVLPQATTIYHSFHNPYPFSVSLMEIPDYHLQPITTFHSNYAKLTTAFPMSDVLTSLLQHKCFCVGYQIALENNKFILETTATCMVWKLLFNCKPLYFYEPDGLFIYLILLQSLWNNMEVILFMQVIELVEELQFLL